MPYLLKKIAHNIINLPSVSESEREQVATYRYLAFDEYCNWYATLPQNVNILKYSILIVRAFNNNGKYAAEYHKKAHSLACEMTYRVTRPIKNKLLSEGIEKLDDKYFDALEAQKYESFMDELFYLKLYDYLDKIYYVNKSNTH